MLAIFAHVASETAAMFYGFESGIAGGKMGRWLKSGSSDAELTVPRLVPDSPPLAGTRVKVDPCTHMHHRLSASR